MVVGLVVPECMFSSVYAAAMLADLNASVS